MLAHNLLFFYLFFFAMNQPALWGGKPLLAGSPLLCNVKILPRLFFRRHFATFPRLRCRHAFLQCNSPNRSFKVSRPNYGLSPYPRLKNPYTKQNGGTSFRQSSEPAPILRRKLGSQFRDSWKAAQTPKLLGTALCLDPTLVTSWKPNPWTK